MGYIPFNYNEINIAAGTYNPSPVKAYNNYSFNFWERALFQRALSVLKINLPEEWDGSIKDFFNYCLYKFGFVAVFNYNKYGTIFQPCMLSGYDLYYRPTTATISNPAMPSLPQLTIGKDCQILKLTPDFFGVWDIIQYYASKLSELDCAIDISLINNKYAFMIAAKDKGSANAIKKMLDLINKGEPAVVYDVKMNNNTDGEPWNVWDRGDLKGQYLTTDQLADFSTILMNFDKEIGIKTTNQGKKERMVVAEAEGQDRDTVSRSEIWLETFNESAGPVNEMFGLNISAERREVEENGIMQDNNDRNVSI